jgi:hypothetical protein
MPNERTNALYTAGELLEEILFLDPGCTIDGSIRKKIQGVLRHYPKKIELNTLVRDVERHCPRPMLCMQNAIKALDAGDINN